MTLHPSHSEPDVDLENQYYNSKSLKEKDPNAALDSFQRVLDLENGEKGRASSAAQLSSCTFY